MRVLFTVVALALVATSFAVADDNETLIAQEKLYNMPKGSFWFAYDFSKEPVSTGAVRVELSGNYCGPTYIGSVLYTSEKDQKSWSSSANSKGMWQIKEKSVYQLRVLIQQPKFKVADCTIKVFASTLVGGTNDESFIGVLEYAGGYDPNLMIPIYPARKVKSFRISVPEYCTGIDILEAGVAVEGLFEKAKMIDKSLNTYSVNDGHGLVVGGIAMKLNGPAKSCTIPVFIKE